MIGRIEDLISDVQERVPRLVTGLWKRGGGYGPPCPSVLFRRLSISDAVVRNFVVTSATEYSSSRWRRTTIDWGPKSSHNRGLRGLQCKSMQSILIYKGKRYPEFLFFY